MDYRSGNSGYGDARYKYTEKERDAETGYDYFGARYYDARVGRWLGVDPMQEESPNTSPCAYASNDPMNSIDRDGMRDEKVRDYARDNLLKIKYGYGLAPYPGANWKIVDENVASCDQLVARGYRYGGGYLTFPVGMAEQVDWFKANGQFSTDRNSADIGDVLFFGDVSTQGKRHEVIVSDVRDKNGETQYKYIGARGFDRKTKEGLPSRESQSWTTINRLEEQDWFGKEFYGFGAANWTDGGEPLAVSPHVSALNDRAFGLGPSPREMWNAFHNVAPTDNTRVGR